MDIMTVKEVSEYLKISDKTVYKLASQDKLPAFKVGGSWRFQKIKIDAWINAQRNKEGKL